MRLVFIHGWGFDASFWEPLSRALSDMPQTRGDLGFFSQQAKIPPVTNDDILVGHSLGFLWGMTHSNQWHRWISINGFARFTDNTHNKACVPPSALRALRQNLAKNPEQTLQNFHKSIGATEQLKAPNATHLAAGLEILQNGDATSTLRSSILRGLVLAATNDPLIPVAASEFLATQNKNTKILWQEGGHLLPQIHTDWCAQAIRDFLA